MYKTNILLLLFSLLLNAKSSAQQTIGLFKDSTGNLDGYVLFTPYAYDSTYLIDKCGKLVHSWGSAYNPGLAVYLLPDGTLLRAGCIPTPYFNVGGKGGIIELFDWDSNILWSYTISDNTKCLHHDICKLPNGNILAIVWEIHLAAECIANGKNPFQVPDTLWSDKIVELQPIGIDSAAIVWEWRDWDHLIQDYDSTKLNYGVIANHPELINVNFYNSANDPDWIHTNTVYYNVAKDQILMCAHNFSEVWIIDHSTSIAQAASHSGGISGKGGDLLYRWGNPQTYNRGTSTDEKFFTLHNAYWIPNGFKDSGKIMLFNNGLLRPAGTYSSVEIFTPPIDSLGTYSITNNQPYQPDSSDWIYTNPIPTNFYSADMSGSQRLSNGNTLICNADIGEFFEIDSARSIVWDYVCPVNPMGRMTQGVNSADQDAVFRCTLYEPDYPGFIGHALIPGNPIEIDPLNYICDMLTNTSSAKENNFEMSIYPNPASTVITIENLLFTNYDFLEFTDILGREIYSRQINNSTQITVDISKWSNGVYFYTFKSINGISRGQFVKQ
jgi:arylsulfotransferase ASST/type IX secretion system substrate protein